MDNAQTVTQHYLAAALWAETDEAGDPLDNTYAVGDFPSPVQAEARAMVAAFLETNAADLETSGLSPEEIGHDLWLTRNGHGAGFWDRGLGEVGERLSRAVGALGEASVYVGDDGQLDIA